MVFDHALALFSAVVAFFTLVISAGGLATVVVQLRDAARQRESDSLVGILDTNRKLISLGFSHPALFAVLSDAKNVDPVLERYFLQLWLNQFSLLHTHFKNAVFRGEQRESFERELSSFLGMSNMQKHWHEFGKFYPDSFQQYVNGILERIEPQEAAHVQRPI